MYRFTTWLKTNKKLLFLACAAILLLTCSYTSLLLNSFINGKFTTNFFDAIEVVRTNGFNSSAAVVSLLFWFIFACFLIYRFKTVDDPVSHPIDKNRSYSDKDNYGNARFEKPEDYRPLAQIRSIDRCVGHIYGMLDKEGKECIDFFPDPMDPEAHLNNHIFAIGASGSGKTYTTGLTYCFQSIKMDHSVIHTDPKGELFASLANTYREHGYIVRRLNFIEPSKSDGWDCMKAIRMTKDKKKKAELVDKFVTAITSQFSDDPNNIFATAGPGLLLTAVILRLVFDPTIPDEEKTLMKVYKMLNSPGGLPALEKEYFLKENIPVEARQCIGPWETFTSSSENLKGNINVNLASGLRVLNTDSILKLISTDDMDIALPGDEKCAYFIQFPVPNTTYRFPTSLFFTMLFETLQEKATANNRRLNREVDFFLDEFGQIGVLPAWEQRMSVIRSYGLNVFMIIQTMAQFQKQYKNDYLTIMSNCATWLMLGVNEMESARMFSECIGQTTISVETVSEEVGASPVNLFGTKKVSTGTGKTSLLSPSEIKNLPPNTLLIIMQRHNPIFANAVPHTLHPYAKDMKIASDNEEPFFEDKDNLYNDFPVKSERRNLERLKIQEYEASHEPYVRPDNIDDAPYGKAIRRRKPRKRKYLKDGSSKDISGNLKSRNAYVCDSTIYDNDLYAAPEQNITSHEEPILSNADNSASLQDTTACPQVISIQNLITSVAPDSIDKIPTVKETNKVTGRSDALKDRGNISSEISDVVIDKPRKRKKLGGYRPPDIKAH